MNKLAKFIVEKRLLFFLLFAVLVVYSVLMIPKVKVEYSITAYLPQNTDTAKALELMDDEFVTYGTCKIMVKNITFETADALHEEIKELDGVKSFSFEDTEDYYKSSCALFSITFNGTDEDEASRAAYNAVVEKLEGYDFVVPSPLVNDYADKLASEMVIILAIAAVVIFLVLLFTSKSYAEILVFPIVFIIAAVLNMGTNVWLGTISFISNTVCIVLQLALAIDYAIILCHRFTEEKDKSPSDPKGAMITALAAAIPEISSSSLTTISGLVALMFMQLRLGYDLGMVLAKSIVWSLLTVFCLMPGLMLSFSKLMDKTRHKNLVPRMLFWGKGVVKLRYLFLAAFVALVSVGAAFSQQVDYVFSDGAITTDRPTDTKIAVQEVNEIFGYDNMFLILLPKGDYERERQVLDTVEAHEMITTALGISNIEIKDGFYLSDSIDYKRFSELTDMPLSTSRRVLQLYAAANEDYWALLQNRIDDYTVTIIELLDYVFDHDEYLGLTGEDKESFDDMKTMLKDAEAQLIGENYTRLLFNIDGDVESPETFALIEEITPEVRALYPDAIFAGSSMSSYDLKMSFVSDNLIISLLTIAFIYIILLFTFKSWGIPLVLVAVIQGAIFMNFALTVAMGSTVFFFTYLIVSAIQMGATIDYAIVITNRFRKLKQSMDKRSAVSETISQSFPTILTSGTILTVAAFLIGLISSDPLIASIGMTLGIGTLISIGLVLTALPALLYILDKPLEKTIFRPKKPKEKKPKKKNQLASLLNTVYNIQSALNSGGNINQLPVPSDTLGEASPQTEINEQVVENVGAIKTQSDSPPEHIEADVSASATAKSGKQKAIKKSKSKGSTEAAEKGEEQTK